jgi:hypothetical protein
VKKAPPKPAKTKKRPPETEVQLAIPPARAQSFDPEGPLPEAFKAFVSARLGTKRWAVGGRLCKSLRETGIDRCVRDSTIRAMWHDYKLGMGSIDSPMSPVEIVTLRNIALGGGVFLDSDLGPYIRRGTDVSRTVFGRLLQLGMLEGGKDGLLEGNDQTYHLSSKARELLSA